MMPAIKITRYTKRNINRNETRERHISSCIHGESLSDMDGKRWIATQNPNITPRREANDLLKPLQRLWQTKITSIPPRRTSSQLKCKELKYKSMIHL
jgi:hypothetical protein